MQREPKIGMPVVYQQGESDSPLGRREGYSARCYPALISWIRQDGVVDLVVLPPSWYQHEYRVHVPRGKPTDTSACWYFPEEG